MWPFGNKKKIEQLNGEVAVLQAEVDEFNGKKKRIRSIVEVSGDATSRSRLPQYPSGVRSLQEEYLFTGDVTKNYMGEYAQDKSDLAETDYSTLQKQCYDAFKIFPYGKRVIEMITDFVIGTELTFSIDDKFKHKKLVEPVLIEFWNNYDNNFDVQLEAMINELWVLGEQMYPPITDKFTKNVRLGVIDPREVEEIIRDNNNQKRLKQVVLNPDSYGRQRVYGVIQEVDGRLSVPADSKTVASGQQYAGDTFLFQINRLPTQTRGYSELTTMLEPLDLLDQFIFEVSERSLLMFHFIADILIKGKSGEDVRKFPVPDPRKNSTFKHNETVEMKMHTPDLKAVDAEKIVKIITRYILAGVGIPEHWVVDGGNSNLATAKEQNNPIEKRLERKQGTIKYMIRTLIRYQLEQKFPKKSAQEIQEMMDSIHLDFPTVAGVDRKLRAQVLNETAKFLVVSSGQGWISGDDAGQEMVNLANKYGMKLSALKLDKEMQKLTGKKTGDQIQDYFNTVDGMAKDIQKTAPPKIGKSKIDLKTV